MSIIIFLLGLLLQLFGFGVFSVNPPKNVPFFVSLWRQKEYQNTPRLLPRFKYGMVFGLALFICGAVLMKFSDQAAIFFRF